MRSIKKTLEKVEKNKSQNKVKPFEFNRDVSDEEFKKSPVKNDSNSDTNSLLHTPADRS